MSSSTCFCTVLYVSISDLTVSLRMAFCGCRWKNIAPPPRKGSRYTRSRTSLGKRERMWSAMADLPPAHLRNGDASTRLSSSIFPDLNSC